MGNQRTQLCAWLVSAHYLLCWISDLPDGTLQPSTGCHVRQTWRRHCKSFGDFYFTSMTRLSSLDSACPQFSSQASEILILRRIRIININVSDFTFSWYLFLYLIKLCYSYYLLHVSQLNHKHKKYLYLTNGNQTLKNNVFVFWNKRARSNNKIIKELFLMGHFLLKTLAAKWIPEIED